MLPVEDNLSLTELCERAGVTPRTVRYYIQQGLLPSPGSGRKARYAREHLLFLQAIAALKRDHLPLAEIRRSLEGLSMSALERVASRSFNPGASSNNASDYARTLLENAPSGSLRRPVHRPIPAIGPHPRPPDRSVWERVTLSSDVELHMRRPLSRDQRRRVDQLLVLARNLFVESNEP